MIVPTYRRPKEIIELLTWLTRLPDQPGEVIIVDGSPRLTVNVVVQQWARTRDLQFDIVYISSPPGLTRQRNVGIDAATRDLIFFLDDDCLPEPGYFAEIQNVFAEDKTGDVGAVRGFLTNGINKPLTRLWRLRGMLGIVPTGVPGQYHPCGASGTWDMVAPFRGVRRIDILAGGASAYRRQVFLKHRFSEFFYGYAQGEDLEMSLRIGKDWKLLVCGDARVNHNHAEGGRPAGFPRGQMAFRNRYFIWKRHSPDAAFKHRVQFWADHMLVIIYNLLVFAARPWRPYNFSYVMGTIRGIIDCLVSPPRHTEPPAQQKYEFYLSELRGRSHPHQPVSCPQ